MVELHQSNRIPPNTWVVDLDTIAENARVLAKKAKDLGLRTYLMSKQHNRNPYINGVALACGLEKMVAVDAQGVMAIRRYSLPLGHAGHLNQIPRGLVPTVVEMLPEVITLYNVEHARWVNDAAEKYGRIQDVMVRIFSDKGLCFDGQEGGILESELPAFAGEIRRLKHIRLSGVTAFPCVTYNESAEKKPALTGNVKSLISAADYLREAGFPVSQINTPGNTDCEVMELLQKAGATHVEPGNALLGTTPNHAFLPDRPERTAFAYLTEISHLHKGRGFAYGGGVYHNNYSDRYYGLIGSTWEEARENRVYYNHKIVQDIDYHMQLVPENGQRCEPGDSVLFAYRTQMHMTRSYVAPISGISGKRPLKVHYLFDNSVNAFDENFNPISPELVKEDLDQLIGSYA